MFETGYIFFDIFFFLFLFSVAENYVPLTRKLALFKEMDEEFGKKMKVAINNLPPDYTENVSQKK